MRAAVAVLFLLLTGCGLLPEGRELEETALIQTMGVDRLPDGQVEVTVSTGSDLRGERSGASGPVILTRQGESISGASLAMRGEGAAALFYGHVGDLLLGEALARAGVEPVLHYVLRDIQMRLETDLYVVRGATAGAAVETGAGESSAADRLAVIAAANRPRTVKEVLGELEDRGCSYVPALALAGEPGEMVPAGYGLLKEGGRLAGWAEGEAALGVELLEGTVEQEMAQLPGPASVRVVGAKTGVFPLLTGGRLTGLRLRCRLEGNLAESGVDLGDPAARAGVEAALERWGEARLRAALRLSQTLDRDFFGLLRRCGSRVPWRWDQIRRDWDLDRLAIEVEVEGRVRRGYDVKREGRKP